jgi:uncharacterized membrane protein
MTLKFLTFRHAWVTLLSMLIVQGLAYTHLPDAMPIHWNVSGEIDGHGSKPWGVWLTPIIFWLVTILMMAVPRLSPHRFSMEPFARLYRTFVTVFAGFGFWLMLLQDAVALGWPVSLPRQALFAVGIVYMILGNGLGKITRNLYFGIRTPWTMADADVWDRTHRLAAPLVMLTGLGVAISAAWDPRAGLAVLLGGSTVGFGLPTLYSWWISRHPTTPDPQDTP